MINAMQEIKVIEEKPLEVVCECDDVIELELDSITEGEVGEPVDISTPVGTIRATWLGPVGNGPGAISLTEACRLMWRIAEERGYGTGDG